MPVPMQHHLSIVLRTGVTPTRMPVLAAHMLDHLVDDAELTGVMLVLVDY